MKLRSLLPVLAVAANPIYAGTITQTAKAPAEQKIQEENLDIAEATEDLIATLHRYASLTNEITDLELYVKDIKDKTEAAKEERKQNIAKIKAAYLAPEVQGDSEQHTLSDIAAPQNTVFFIGGTTIANLEQPAIYQTKKTKTDALKTYTLEDIFRVPVSFPADAKTYGISLEKEETICVAGKDPCLAEKEEKTVKVYTIKKEGTDNFLVSYTIQTATLEKKEGLPEDVWTNLQTSVTKGPQFQEAAEYYRGSDGTYTLIATTANFSEEQRVYVEKQYESAVGKITPLLKAKVKELEAQKPTLEKQLTDAQKEYSQTQLPPAL